MVEQIGDGEFQGFSQTRVLGEGGCMFVAASSVGYLSLFKLSISVAGRVIHADGRVVYERLRRRLGPGDIVEVGIEFLRLDPDDRSFLRAFCSEPS